jgi:hypothetical protein
LQKEEYILLGALVGAAVAFIGAVLTSVVQLKIAKNNSKKDIQLQLNNIENERLKAQVELERSKLESLHIILSQVSFENSITMSYIQSDSESKIEDFRVRYIANCERIFEALAISEMYYSNMKPKIKEIYKQMNLFWGHQESVIQINSSENNAGWSDNLGEVIKSGREISAKVNDLHSEIALRSLELNKAIKSDS